MEGKFIKIGKNRVLAEEFLAAGHNFCIGGRERDN